VVEVEVVVRTNEKVVAEEVVEVVVEVVAEVVAEVVLLIKTKKKEVAEVVKRKSKGWIKGRESVEDHQLVIY
jgi:hypothetical protein